jgi:PhzF family phenazine biosynthesis protein
MLLSHPNQETGTFMGLTITQVDAFTNQPFSGNPAAVCVLPEPRNDEWMQNVAREMNLSETAFLLQQKDGFNLRWFTPTIEIDLCGHATLASAHALWELGYLEPHQEARFHTRSGLLTAQCQEDWIVLNFPAQPAAAIAPPPELALALGVTNLRYVGHNQVDYLVELESETLVHDLQPNLTLLKTFPVRGIIITSRADDGEYDFVSRFFAPQSGIDEDPVTGSAHCCLGPYWQERLKKDEFLAYQASPRGGVLRVHCQGDRVAIAGQAVTVLKGELMH